MRPPPRVAAHRGGGGLWPENSLRAFRGALALGVDLVEADLHMTADGEVVLLHDPTLDRTTTGHGPVGAVPRRALASLRLRAGDGSVTDEPVPTLDELLDLVGPGGAGLLLEIKRGPGGRPYPDIEARVLAALGARGLTPRGVVMAFEAETVRCARTLEPAIRACLLVRRAIVGPTRVTAADAVARARAAGATDLGLDHRMVDGRVIKAVRAADLGLAAWTVDDEDDMGRLIALGVDVLVTNRPDLARRLLGEGVERRVPGETRGILET